mmetsp:Transcript_25969/g.38019  ORF Transcript_25969/g.38019 Transcript_25969/m.38019 type:complete len:121 (-) Transcript_25969:48-410(-)
MVRKVDLYPNESRLSSDQSPSEGRVHDDFHSLRVAYFACGDSKCQNCVYIKRKLICDVRMDFRRCLPSDKREIAIATLPNDYGIVVGMTGDDKVNGSAAQSAAQVGITMGGSTDGCCKGI